MSRPLLLALVAIVACERAPAAPPASAAPPPGLEQLLSAAISARSSAEALAKNGAAHQASLSKHARIFDADRVHERLPFTLDRALLESQLASILRKTGVKSVSLEVEAVAPPARTLPETAPGDTRFVLERDDVVADVRVRLELAPPDLDRARALRDALRAAGPLWRWERVTLGAKTVKVEALCAALREVTMPRYVLARPDLDADLQRAGVPRMGELLSGPHRALANELQGEYVRRVAAINDAEPGLRNLALVQLNDARYLHFKRIASAVEAETFTDLLK